MKQRTLKLGQEVVIIYIHGVGYVNKAAIFKEYRRIILSPDVSHETPIFELEGDEVSGLQCFWLLKEEATVDRIKMVQKQLPLLQIAAYEKAMELQYTMPEKVQDPELKKIAASAAEQMSSIVQKLGFDPRDESWLEELAENPREKNWFEFEKENTLILSGNWDDVTAVFNQQYKDNISPEMAKNLAKRRMRFYLGAYYTRLSGEQDKQVWFAAAQEFERKHRDRENRMLTWTLAHVGRFPLVRSVKPIRFSPGPYFNEFLERAPSLFHDPTCKFIRAGLVLRVISYDSVDRYIRLDFMEDIRSLIKPNEPKDAKIWLKDSADYDLWLQPGEMESYLELLDSLD